MATSAPSAPALKINEHIDPSGGTYTTSSWAPTDGKLYILVFAVANDTNGSFTGSASASGNSMTWTSQHQVLTWGGRRAAAMFRSLPASGSSTGTTVITPPTVPGGGTLGNAHVAIIEIDNPDTGGTNGADAVAESLMRAEAGSAATIEWTQDEEADVGTNEVAMEDSGEINLFGFAGENQENVTWSDTVTYDAFADLKTGDAPSSIVELFDATDADDIRQASGAYTLQGALNAVGASTIADVSWTTGNAKLVWHVCARQATVAPTATISQVGSTISTINAENITTGLTNTEGNLQIVTFVSRSGSTTLREDPGNTGDSGWTYRSINTDPADTSARHTLGLAYRVVPASAGNTQHDNSAGDSGTWQEFEISISAGTWQDDTDADEADIAVQTDGAAPTVRRIHGRVQKPVGEGIVLGFVGHRHGSNAYGTDLRYFNGFTLLGKNHSGSNQNSRTNLVMWRKAAADELLSPGINQDVADEQTMATYVFSGGAAAGDNIDAPFISSGSTLYTPTVEAGAVNIDAPFIASTSALYTPTVESTANIDAPFIASGSVLYTPSVQAGAANIDAPFIASGSTTYTPAVAAGAVNIDVPHLASTSALYTPTVESVLNIDVPFIASGSALYTPTVEAGAANIDAPFIASGSTLYTPSVVVSGAPQNIDAPFISAGSVLYTPSVGAGAVNVDAPFIASGSTTYVPAVGATYNIDAPFISSGSVLYTPTVEVAGGAQNIDSPFISSGSVLYTPVVAGGTANITAPFISSGSTTFAPTVGATVNVDAPFIASGSTVYVPGVAAGAANIDVPFIVSTAQVYVPSVLLALQEIDAPFISSGSVVYAPAVATSRIWENTPEGQIDVSALGSQTSLLREKVRVQWRKQRDLKV